MSDHANDTHRVPAGVLAREASDADAIISIGDHLSERATQNIRRLWLSGVGTDSCARAIATSQAVVAAKLWGLSDEDLLKGLRAHLENLLVAKAESKAAKEKE